MKRFLKYSFSLLNVEYVKLNHNWNFKNVLSPYYRIYYIDEGEGHISTDGDDLLLEAGYLYIIPSFTLCSLSCDEYLSQYFIQFFEESGNGISLFQNNRTIMKIQANETDVANMKRVLHINPGRGINRSNNPKIYEKHIYYKEYQELNNDQSISTFIETQGIILQIISRFLNLGSFKPLSSSSIPDRILDAMNYIQLNLSQHLTVAHLAERANQNQDYFSRLFMESTGLRPLMYIHERKIERAQYLMTTTGMSYSKIIEEIGFEDLSYFSRTFKKITGFTPEQYKKENFNINNI
jgi:AraC-like DNA-binding protein